MAKRQAGSRKTTRKTTSRKAAATRGARKARPRSAPRGPRKIELRPIRKQVENTLARLDRVAEPTDAVKDAIKRLQRCLTEIEGICGANMMLPLP